MKQIFLVLALAAFAGFALAVAPITSAQRAPDVSGPAAPAELVTPNACGRVSGPNLLENYSFEGEYTDYIPPGGHPECPTGICDTADTPAGWTPWWEPHPPEDPSWYYVYMPEFKPAELGIPGPVRVRSGARAQQYFSVWRTHYAGVYQQVNVSPGSCYCFSAYGHSWSADDDDYLSGPFYGNLEQRVGIDVLGGIDWHSDNIVWGPQRQQYDEYGLFSVAAQAEGETISVYVYSHPEYPVKHNDVYWDDAQLAVLPSSTETMLLVATGESGRGRLPVYWPCELGATWTATVMTSAVPLSLTQPSGAFGEMLEFSVDASMVPTGTYTATVTVAGNRPETNEQASITIRIVVLSEMFERYLPAIVGLPD